MILRTMPTDITLVPTSQESHEKSHYSSSGASVIIPSMKFLPVRTSQGVLFAKVDDADFNAASKFKWRMARSDRYPRNSTIGRLHVLIIARMVSKDDWLRYEERKEVVADHINRDRMDCTRSNLRLVTHAENCRNRSPGRFPTGGVYHFSDKWRARFRFKGKAYSKVFNDHADAEVWLRDLIASVLSRPLPAVSS